MINISVIVVCFNEEDNIWACLESLTLQSYLIDNFEIIVVDGGSKDQTQTIIADFVKEYSHIKMVVEPRAGTAIGRNAGVAAAQHPFVAFIDADCEAPPDWLERLAYNFVEYSKSDPHLVAVGGGNIPPPDSGPFVQAVGVAMDSFAGSFNSAQGRQFAEVKYVSSLATLNVIYNKQAINDVGGFDISLGSEAEDAELNFRLFYQGKRFIFIPDLHVLHKFRPTPTVWFKNMLRYGRGRARLLKRHKNMWSISYALPLIFLAVFCSLALIFFHPVFALPILYFPFILIYGTILALKKNRAGLSFHVALVFIVQHFAYAIGEASGLLNPQVK
ncbi:MAG: glycosyltransferase [Magnetococcales bacterium]|nr:glycosyltransferase [Magnetococcales bacterium]